MALSIVTNVAALKAQNSLAASTDRLNKSLARLSSGLRINEAQDDPAGLAVADKLRADVRVAGQAIRNANDGVSAINIADKALEQIGNSLARLAELAEQSATGTLNDTQRTSLQSEFAALVSEIDRIAATTTKCCGATWPQLPGPCSPRLRSSPGCWLRVLSSLPPHRSAGRRPQTALSHRHRPYRPPRVHCLPAIAQPV